MCAQVCGDASGCNPCNAPTNFLPCPPGGDCCQCDCADYSNCCYQQPARAQPILPVSNISRATAPLETDTIYKRSYFANNGDGYRAKPLLPCDNIPLNSGRFETCTVQKLSYLPPCNVSRTMPIRPPENNLQFNGPLYGMTSQKHDFVPKAFSRRSPIFPIEGICRPNAPIERCTVNKLSYLPNDVCQNPPPKPIIQGYHYLRPTGPGEKCTIQKLSYMPVCIPSRDPMPWAAKVRCVPPPYTNLCTTYKLSYLPNNNAGPAQPVHPINGLQFLGTDPGDRNTTYKLSYMPVGGTRPLPIHPVNAIPMPSGEMEKCTVQKLSYQPNCCVARTMPIRPKENCIKPVGALYNMTTQKHDFVAKPCTRTAPIHPVDYICRASGPMEKCTINKLSYMPVNVCEYRPPQPIRPVPGVGTAGGPVEKCTTYKLSYMPNCIIPKEPLPWARVSNYVRPTTPIEKCTIQKLSYGPPGTFSRCGNCPGVAPQAPCGGFPTAGIC